MRYLLILLFILFSSEIISSEKDVITELKLDNELAKGRYDLYLCHDYDKNSVGVYTILSKGKELNVPICIKSGEYGPMGYVLKETSKNTVCLTQENGHCDETGLCTSFVLPDLCGTSAP